MLQQQTEESTEEGFPLVVASLSGQEEEIKVSHMMTVLELKMHLAKIHETTAAALKLTNGGDVMLDHQSLEECGVSNGASVGLVHSILPAGFDEMSADEQAALLWQAAKTGDVALTMALIDQGVDKSANGPAKRGCVETLRQGSPLWEATKRGHAGTALALIAANAELEAGGPLEYGFKWATRGSPALIAAQSGHEAILGALLDARANIEASGSWNRDYKMDRMRGKFRGPAGCPLGLATIHGHTSAVAALLEAKADTEKCCIFQGNEAADGMELSGIGTALYAGAALGHLNIVKLLLDAKADTDCLGLCTVGNDNPDTICAYAHPLAFNSHLLFLDTEDRALPCYQRLSKSSDCPERPISVARRYGRTEITESLAEAEGDNSGS